MSQDSKIDFSYEPFWSEPHVRTLVRVIGWALYSGQYGLSLSMLPRVIWRRYSMMEGGTHLPRGDVRFIAVRIDQHVL